MRKNFIEKGFRFLEIISNPHSYGDIFSVYCCVFIEIKTDKKKITLLKKILNNKIQKQDIIIFCLFYWK